MKFNVLTIFPEMITDYTSKSILCRGQEAGVISINAVNIRDFATDKHSTVDDTPYGGGAGMVMKPEPIFAALKSIDAIPFHKYTGLQKVKKIFTGGLSKKKRTVVLSPRGRQFDQRIAEEWSRLDELTLICGRYEGIDQRVVDYMIDEEISVGPYVLAGGELGALVIVEAVSRLVPGVLGNPDSLQEETHGLRMTGNGLQTVDSSLSTVDQKEYPQYTKPSDFRGWTVPDVLLSGDHKRIEEWRREGATGNE
ncbi:MAG: tRNA (guanosine(37)-N1)-methyltransferase TrmD [Candidatus Magasanikbacteria bacterium CG11_big_fil_rev_8_21_14_0_20_43_7]|uniref:tRNA (guanine-N(1)-)-methyltransferase n=1 Tax=Candidatus Magasanikbacteria bacterium CG11_big_fil_rev_8_21_14_0_20_43_7 TaxID=1974654 RepID=A0A2H0N2H2_9BACT|nr:MAG: tRNA (guanosine(37)-N1)-methyltransferase TrmD [Candidatus Magasanikbacteria bacterium CG11_big_fil_rev_8_21_14_0_20_43_7]